MAKKPKQWKQNSSDHVKLTGKINYLRLTGGNKYRIRVVSVLYGFNRLFKKIGGQTKTAIADDSTIKNLPNDVTVAERYVMYVIDRADGIIKTLEVPHFVVESITNQTDLTGHMPTDPQNGYDYSIQVTGTGAKTRYTVTPLTVTPLTAKERKSVKSQTERPLNVLYKCHTMEQITDRLLL